MDDIIETILRKMCEMNGYNFDNITWNNGTHLKLPYTTPTSENEMIDWLTDYLYSLKISDIRKIIDYPHTIYRRKKECRKFANNFIFMYGFKSYECDIKVIRSKKINNIIKNI